MNQIAGVNNQVFNKGSESERQKGKREKTRMERDKRKGRKERRTKRTGMGKENENGASRIFQWGR